MLLHLQSILYDHRQDQILTYFGVSPLLPLVFRLQFWYCYSFCPVNIDTEESLDLAKNMSEKYASETKLAWRDFIKRT
mgnify:CR=1 FL=1